jgi:hypothetical protein
MDHEYSKSATLRELEGTRAASFVSFDHGYFTPKNSTPKKQVKRKHECTTPTGKTPKHAVKFCVLEVSNVHIPMLNGYDVVSNAPLLNIEHISFLSL